MARLRRCFTILRNWRSIDPFEVFLGFGMLVAMIVIVLHLFAIVSPAFAAERKVTVEEAFKAGYDMGIKAKLRACELGELRSS